MDKWGLINCDMSGNCILLKIMFVIFILLQTYYIYLRIKNEKMKNEKNESNKEKNKI